MIDKYTWVDLGSSYLPGELQAAYLYGQLEKVEEIKESRMKTWRFFYENLSELSANGKLELPIIPAECISNAHMFYVKLPDIGVRTKVLEYLKNNGIGAVFHYIPLHSAPAGIRLGAFVGKDKFTTSESERLIRLPIWYGMTDIERATVVDAVVEAVNACC